MEEAEVKKEAGMIKPTTRSIIRKKNDTSVIRRNIQITTIPRLKKIKIMTTRSQRPPLVDQT